MSEVVALRITKPAPKKLTQPNKSSRVRAKYYRQAGASVAVATIGLVLTALSLSHLSHGVVIVTGVPAWEAWAMAIGIDLSFVGLEVAQLCAVTEHMRRTIGRYTRPAIIGTLIGSAMMNAFAFGNGATGYWIIPAVALGIAIPGLIYVLTRIATALWLGCQR